MRNRNRLYLWLAVLILAGTLGGVGLMILRTPPPKVSKENFAKIYEGMTMEEVEQILGATFFRIGGVRTSHAIYSGQRLPPWEPEQITIVVTYHPYYPNRVTGKTIDVSERTWKARLTEWLPW
jgi:hypothetical protein